MINDNNNEYPIYYKDINDNDVSMNRYNMRRNFDFDRRRRDFDFDRRRSDFDFYRRRRDFDFDRRRDFDFDFPLWFFFWRFFF